mgnify:CR=1 FL=1
MKKGLIVLTIVLAVTLALTGMLFAQAKKGPAGKVAGSTYRVPRPGMNSGNCTNELTFL